MNGTRGAGDGDGRRPFLLFLAALLLLGAAYLGRALAGEVFVSTETVWNTVQPWSGVGPPVAPHNEFLADQPTVWLPMQALTRSLVRGGESPLYTHESYAGAPWLGNMSSALFSPFTWLFVVLPFAPAFAICAALKWILAGIGAWFLARRLGAGSWGAALAGLVFAFCGFQVVWIDSCLTNVAVGAPWLLLALERCLERPSAGRTVVLALAAWQVLVGGHPETSLYVGLGAVVLAALRWWALPAAERPRTLLALLGAATVAALLAAPQWLPFLEYALSSFGHRLRELGPRAVRPLFAVASLSGAALVLFALLGVILGGGAWRRDDARAPGRVLALLALVASGVALRATGLRPDAVLQLLPDWHGRPLDGGSYDGPLTYNDVTAGFCGAAVFVLALATALRGGNRRVRALSAAGLVAGARFFRVPVVANVLDLPLAQTGSTRALAFVALAVALLAGLGFAAWRDGDRALRRMVVAALALLVGTVVPCERFALAAAAPPPATAWFDRDGADLTGGRNATLHGRCVPDATMVRIDANGAALGHADLLPPAAGETSARFTYRWLGSERLDEGLVDLRLTVVGADGSERAGEERRVDLTRAPHPSARWLVPLAAVVVAFLLLPLVPSARARGLGFLAVAAAELLFFGVDYNATTPPARMPGAVEPIPLLQRELAERGPARVLPMKTALHPGLHANFGLEVLRGYDALEPLAYTQVLRFLDRPGVIVPWTEVDFDSLALEPGSTGRALLDFLGVRYVMSTQPAAGGFVERWRRGDLALYENPAAFPRAFTVQRWMTAAEMEARHEDLRVAAAWPAEAGAAASGAFAGSARVVAFDHGRGRMRATVESEQGTILIVTENAAGFRATVDGAPATIRPTHGTFLSVPLPPGRHEVELVYLPRSVVAGAAAGALGGVVVLVLLLARRRRASARGGATAPVP